MVSFIGVAREPAPSIIERTTMEHYAGIDMSLESASGDRDNSPVTMLPRPGLPVAGAAAPPRRY
jgi:hypothetical protein